jgi:hypothetical protein
MSKALELIELAHGLLRDLPDCRLWGVDDGALVLGGDATQFVFCWQGALTVRQSGAWPHVLTAGMWAAVPGKAEIRPVGTDLSRGLVISRAGWLGMMQIGGPLEERGRLRYIDGCTDSLLVPPVRLGDPCLNGLWFPMGTVQTMHSHPSVRVRMAEIVRGMVDDGVPEKEIRERLGMEAEDVIRLVNRSGMPTQAGGGSFNKAWIPGKS